MYLLIPHGCGNTTTHCCLSLSVQNVEVRPACSNVNTTLHRVHAMPIVFYADCLDCFVSSFQTATEGGQLVIIEVRGQLLCENIRGEYSHETATLSIQSYFMVKSTMSDTATIINVFVLQQHSQHSIGSWVMSLTINIQQYLFLGTALMPIIFFALMK